MSQKKIEELEKDREGSRKKITREGLRRRMKNEELEDRRTRREGT